MPRSIVIVGAGPGLGRAVAERYARGGYSLALIARRRDPVTAIAAELTVAGARAYAVPADLADTAGLSALTAQIRAHIGEPDAIYFGPTPSATTDRAPAAPAAPSELTAEDVQAHMPVALHSLVELVREFLPHMREQRDGAILAAGGASAVTGVPYFSRPGPALAAQRNYLQCLEAELTGSGVFVGRLYVGATIQGSAWHQRLQAQQAAGQPDRAGDAIVAPQDLADILWNMHHATKQPEILYPAGAFAADLA